MTQQAGGELGDGGELTRYDLQQQHEFEAVSEVLLDAVYLRAGLAQVRVAPCGEGLKNKTNAGNSLSLYRNLFVFF